MSRQAKGSVEHRHGKWWARVTIGTQRPWVPIEPALTDPNDRGVAVVEAAVLSRCARAAPRDGGPGESVEDWYDRWLAARTARGTSARAPRSHLTNHILPILRSAEMAKVTPRDLERVVRHLDDSVTAGKLRWKAAINIWGTVTKAFDDAHRGKLAELRCREDNPTKSVRGPDRGVDTAKVHLYPSELLTLVACEAVPLVRRQAYAIGVYLYLRPAELEALAWDDLDLARGQVTIRRSIERESGKGKAPKAGVARHPQDVEPALLPLLRAMHHDGAAGPVVGRLGDERELAEQLRRDLLTAGVPRHELHFASNEPPREWMRMHDLRTTGVTWMAVRGGDPMTIMARAGHHDIETTLGYVSQAALVRGGYGDAFPTLPEVLIQSSLESSSRGAEGLVSRTFVAEAHGNRRDRAPRDGARKPRLSLLMARGDTAGHVANHAIPRDEDDCGDDWTEARIDLVQRLLEGAKRAAGRGDTAAFWRLFRGAEDAAPRVAAPSPAARRGVG